VFTEPLLNNGRRDTYTDSKLNLTSLLLIFQNRESGPTNKQAILCEGEADGLFYEYIFLLPLMTLILQSVY
jgi:hypothetical protein